MPRKPSFSPDDLPLSADKSVPLYQQLKEALAAQIKGGSLQADERLPSEKELCAMYNVSRITVRQALAELAREGLIYRTHGKGTFVAKPRIQQELVRVTPFEQTLKSKGLQPSTRFLGAARVPADYRLATLLAIPIATEVIRLELLGLGNAKPLVHYLSYLPGKLGEEMEKAAEQLAREGAAFSTIDLYEQIGWTAPATVTQSFEAVGADKERARVLGVKVGDPILLITSLVYSSDGRPMEYKLASYRGDQYSFHLTRPVHAGSDL